MANKNLFPSRKGKSPRPATKTPEGKTYRNEAGGVAFEHGPKMALAQFATTGTLGDAFYTTATEQLKQITETAKDVDSAYLGKLAIYARQKGFMKDMPALLLVILCARVKQGGPAGQEASLVLNKAFHRVVDNPKMLRNFVQILRSAAAGRRSLATQPTRLVRQWFDKRNPHTIFRGTVGNDPTLADIIRLARVQDHGDPQRRALYRYILGMASEDTVAAEQREKNQFYKFSELPPLVQQFETFKKDPANNEVPKVPFQMLTGQPLTTKQWSKIAVDGGWHFTRMNLNTFQRHGVLQDSKAAKAIATKLKDKKAILDSRVFPYQLLTAFLNVDDGVPNSVKNALQDAMEIATQNTPEFGGNVYVFPDVSGSMGCAITGNRGTATSKTTCRDVAALFAACVLRKNEDATVIPVCTRLHTGIKLNARDSVMTNAVKLAPNGGGTHLALGLEHILKKRKPVDTVFFVSDNESWMDRHAVDWYGNRTTAMMDLWNKIRTFSPNGKLVCINIQPYRSTPAQDDESILNIGGFSDNTWTVIDKFVNGTEDVDFVKEIESIDLDEVPTLN